MADREPGFPGRRENGKLTEARRPDSGRRAGSVNHGGSYAIIQGVINFCWSVVKWALLIGLAGAVIAVALLYRRMDEEVRRRVEQHFARHYPDMRVTVGSAELVEGEGIRVRDVSIIEPSVADLVTRHDHQLPILSPGSMATIRWCCWPATLLEVTRGRAGPSRTESSPPRRTHWLDN